MKSLKRYLSMTFACLVVALSGGCGVFHHGNAVPGSATSGGAVSTQAGGTDGSSTTTTGTTGTTSFNLNAIGVKDFRALYASMGAVTSVPHTPMLPAVGNAGAKANPVVAVYNNNVGRLSLNGDATAISAAGLLATGVLAGSHCDTAITSFIAGAPNPMFTGLNFGQTEAQLTPTVRAQFITNVLNAAWPNHPVTPADITDFSAAIDSVIAGGPANSKTTLRAAALVVCAGALSSMPFYEN